MSKVASTAVSLAVITGTVVALLLIPPQHTVALRAPLVDPLLLIETGAGSMTLIRPVDPSTLADMSGYDPILISDNGFSLSPDGQILATFVQDRMAKTPVDMNALINVPGTLHLIHIRSWQDEVTNVTAHGVAVSPRFTADGRSIFWLAPNALSSTPLTPPITFSLYRYDLTPRSSTKILDFPPNEVPNLLSFSRTRQTLVTLVNVIPRLFTMMPRSYSWQIQVIHLSNGNVEHGETIDDVDFIQTVTSTNSLFKSTSSQLYPAARAIDSQRNLLYIVHAANDQVTVIDLDNGKIAGQTQVHFGSATGRQSSGNDQTAGTRREISLSPDGSRLYIASDEITSSPEKDHLLGLTILDTATLSPIRSINLPVSEVRVSPDNRRVVLAGLYGTLRGDGVYILDAQTDAVLGHLEPDMSLSLAGFSPDSRYAYVSLYDNSKNRTTKLQIIDLTSNRIIGERELSEVAARLFSAVGQSSIF